MSRPIIGISCNYKPHEGEQGTFNLDRAYTEAVYRNGGIPQIIPIIPVEEIPELLRLYDGIMLSGGGGLLPHVKEMAPLPGLREQNPIRYEFETQLIKQAIEREIPVLGLCRGHQMINETLGGTLINLPDEKHRQQTPGDQASHNIRIEHDSGLYHCINHANVAVNSFHRQAIGKVGENLKATSYSDDNIIESMESTSANYIVGLQFHPEFMPNNKKMMNIYKDFIQAAKGRRDRSLVRSNPVKNEINQPQ